MSLTRYHFSTPRGKPSLYVSRAACQARKRPDEGRGVRPSDPPLGRRRARDREELVANVRGYLRGRQRRPDVVKAYFHEEHVRYAAD